jgi:hypothetical protein
VITCDKGLVRAHCDGEERNTDDLACCLVIGDGGLEMVEAVEIRILRKNKTTYEFNSTDEFFQEQEVVVNGAVEGAAAGGSGRRGVEPAAIGSAEGSAQGKTSTHLRVFAPEELDAGGIPKTSCSTLSERIKSEPPPAPKQGTGERYAPYNYISLKKSVFSTLEDPSINVYAVIVSSTTGETESTHPINILSTRLA